MFKCPDYDPGFLLRRLWTRGTCKKQEHCERAKRKYDNFMGGVVSRPHCDGWFRDDELLTKEELEALRSIVGDDEWI